MAIWAGSITAGEVISPDKSDVIAKINVALDSANASEITTARDDIALLGNFVKVIEGVNGSYEVFEEFSGLFQDDGDFLDPEEFKESYAKWTFQRKQYAIKNGSYDKKTFKDAEERKIDLDTVVDKRTMEIIARFMNIYKPNVLFEELMKVPTASGGFYEKFGAVRDTVVKESKLVNVDSTAAAGTTESVTRNNWRAIKSNTGLSLDDTSWVKEYMGNVEGIDEDNLIVFGTSATLEKYKALFSDYSPTKEEILINGVPSGVQSWTIDGLTLVASKMMVKDILMFVNPDAKYLISKLVSPLAKYQGLAIDVPDELNKFVTDAKDLLGSKLVIQSEGVHMTGRLDVLFLDTDITRFNADREMQAGGFAAIEKKRTALRKKWYGSVNELV